MKKCNKRSLKTRRERNKNRVNRLRNEFRRKMGPYMPIMILVSISYKFNLLTSAEKVYERLIFHIFMLTGNGNFPVVDPTLADLQLKADQLQVLINQAKNGDRLVIEQRDIIAREAIELIRSLGADIQKKSGGDAEKIHSAGFSTRKERTSIQPCTKVVIGKITSLGSGDITFELLKVLTAKVYVVMVSTQFSGAPWYLAAHSDKLSFSIDGYEDGDDFVFLSASTRYFFRIYAWNRLGKGENSETADAICLA
ncbi:MAG: hypothetical protein IPP77_02380 [Bacteroidetes bacterium]|nr:hypothetical protein [Bacteroidota bacterium]